MPPRGLRDFLGPDLRRVQNIGGVWMRGEQLLACAPPRLWHLPHRDELERQQDGYGIAQLAFAARDPGHEDACDARQRELQIRHRLWSGEDDSERPARLN